MKKSLVALTRSAMSRKRTALRSAELARGDALALGHLRHRLAVLVRAREEEDVLPALAHVPSEHVGRDRRVRVAQVGLCVDVVDRRRDVVGHRASMLLAAARESRSLSGADNTDQPLPVSGRSSAPTVARLPRTARAVPSGRPRQSAAATTPISAASQPTSTPRPSGWPPDGPESRARAWPPCGLLPPARRPPTQPASRSPHASPRRAERESTRAHDASPGVRRATTSTRRPLPQRRVHRGPLRSGRANARREAAVPCATDPAATGPVTPGRARRPPRPPAPQRRREPERRPATRRRLGCWRDHRPRLRAGDGRRERRQEVERVAVRVPLPGLANAEMEMRLIDRPPPGRSDRADRLAAFDPVPLAHRRRRQVQVRHVVGVVRAAHADGQPGAPAEPT